MNTDKTLMEKFGANRNDYPIWYYKKIKEIHIDYVIFNLLKETFIVEIDNKKITITFGKNRKHEIGSVQSCTEGLDFTSYETIRKAFREGKWFIITDEDTTDDFKEEYKVKEEERKIIEIRNSRIELLTMAIINISDKNKTSKEDANNYISALKEMNDDELMILTEKLFKSFKN